jgi:cytochrome P450
VKTDRVIADIDFLARASADPADPHAALAEIRESGRGVGRAGDQLFLLRYDDCVQALRDPRFGRPVRPEVPIPSIKVFMRNFMGLNPPDHTRLRGVVAPAFKPRAVRAWRARMESAADALLDGITSHGDADLMADFAKPLPVQLIAEVLGVPLADTDRFQQWSEMLISALDHTEPTPERGVAIVRTTEQFVTYMRELFDQKRRHPDDDVISMILAAESAGTCDEDEALAAAILLLVAGQETTVNLIGLGTLAMLRHRDQWDRLVADPTLARSAADELLRYDGPLTNTSWVAGGDVDLGGGLVVEEGQFVNAVITAANRDGRQFDRPDTLDLGRTPNPHLAFSSGIHFCLGAAFARLEAEVAFTALARRCPGLHLAGDPVHAANLAVRGLASLPVEVRS